MAIRDSHHHCSHFQGNDFIFCAAILCAFLALDASHLLYGYGSKVCATGTLWSRGRTDRLTLSPCSVLFRVLQKPKRLSLSYHKFLRTSVLPFRYSPPYLSAFPWEPVRSFSSPPTRHRGLLNLFQEFLARFPCQVLELIGSCLSGFLVEPLNL